MKIGLIIPTYNSEKTLRRCLDSIKKNDFQKDIVFEIIVVDDASTDETIKIIEEYHEKGLIDKKILLQKNKGVSCARNIGINSCFDIDYLSFLDSDDYLEIEFFNNIINNKNLESDAMILGAHIEKEDDLKSRLVQHFKTDMLITKENKKLLNYFENFYLQPNNFSIFARSWGRLYDFKYIRLNKKIRFNEKISTFEDVEFNFQYLLQNPKIQYLNHVMYCHNINNNILKNKSLTFGGNIEISDMFSFIWTLKISKKVINNLSNYKFENLDKKIYHCCSVYTIIQFIRISGKIYNFFSFFIILKKIKKILRKNMFKKFFRNYDQELANGNFLISYLLKKRFFFFALFYARYLYFKRYKNWITF